MTIIDEIMLIKVDPGENNNKFYHLVLHDDDTVTKRWGRVGNPGVTRTEQSGQRGFDRIKREKQRKGYEETAIITGQGASQAKRIQNEEVRKAAQKALVKGDRSTAIDDLINTLVSNNRHEIMQRSGGKITVDDSGQVKTPLGIVTGENITQARHILNNIESSRQYTDPKRISEYLTLIPHQVPMKRGWDKDFFSKLTSVEKEHNFLNQLEASVKWAQTQQKAEEQKNAESTDTDESQYDGLFRLQLQLLEKQPDGDETFERIRRYFERTKNSHYHRYASSLKLKRVFTVFDESKEEDFTKLKDEYGNVRELWHGTSVSNVLSIMRSGLFIPGASQVSNGAMFSRGIYTTDQSTKALNYSTGFWGGNSRHQTGFMFLADVVMGNEFRPNLEGNYGWGDGQRIGRAARNNTDKNGRSYQSISVKGGTCGVKNNEMIVWNADQVKLKYLCEFSA